MFRYLLDVVFLLEGLKESGVGGMFKILIMLVVLFLYIVLNFLRGSKKFLVLVSLFFEVCVKVCRFFMVVLILEEGLLLKILIKVVIRLRRVLIMVLRGFVIVDLVVMEYMNVFILIIFVNISRILKIDGYCIFSCNEIL